MKKLIVLLVLLLANSISYSSDKSQSQTITAQTSQKEVKQLDEYENKILDRVETFYNNRINYLLWIMGAGLVIVGIIVPLLLELQRQKNFKKELARKLKKSEDVLKKYSEGKTEELEAKLTRGVSTPLSMAFVGLATSYAGELSPAAYAIRLQLHVLAMKFNIVSQCSGGSFTASRIISIFTCTNKGAEIPLQNLTVTNELIEVMKEDVKNIVDEKKREEMENQVRELQIYINKLIYDKKQTPIPQSSPQ